MNRIGLTPHISDPITLASSLGVKNSAIDQILRECGEPEAINNSNITAPSKRLETLAPRYKKTSTGIAIAQNIGLPKMRAKCPIFNEWLTTIEALGDN
jgi:hypothetical protein